MATTHISDLPAASALAGTEVTPVDQGGATKKATITQILAGITTLPGLNLTATAVKTSAYNAVAGDLVPVDTTSGAVTVTLPTAPADKTTVAVKHVIQGGTNAVTIACGGADVINKAGGGTTASLPLSSQAMLLQYKATGAIWYIVADDIPLGSLDLRFAGLAGPTFTGVPAAPTAAQGTNTTQLATTAYVQTEAGLLVPKSLFTTKGDFLGVTGAGVVARHGIGADGQIIQADSTQSDGWKWYGRSRSMADAHADASVVNSVAETTMFTFAVPATAVAGDIIRVTADGDFINNSGGGVTYTLKFKLGATTMLTSNAFSVTASAARRAWFADMFLLIVSPSGSPDQRFAMQLSSTAGGTGAASGTLVLSASASALGGTGKGTAAEDLSGGANLVMTVTLGTANALADFYLHEAVCEVLKR